MDPLSRRELLSLLASGAWAGQAPARKPNIIFILADDLGYGDLGCYGQQRIATPNLDRMAAEGMLFSQAYAGGAVCAPSRCCLMTGRHTGHARIRANQIPGAPDRRLTLGPSDVTVGGVLKRAGYRTGLIGKWSLGGLGSPGYPTRKGFDEWFGFFSQTHAHNYFPELLLEDDHEVLLRGNMGGRKTQYAPDLFTARALEFLERHRSEPFFLHLCTTIPHANNELEDSTGNGMEVPDDAPYSNRDWPQTEKNFAAMITRMDRDVGRLLGQLDKLGLDRNTIVIFSSDNGPHQAGGHDYRFFNSAGPLRGRKGDLYDGGIRVPFLVRWPGVVAPSSASNEPIAFWDFLPTAAELAGAPAPPGLDGLSIVPLLTGHPLPATRHLYWEYPVRSGFLQAARLGDWKAVRKNPSGDIELYNLRQDPGESIDVAAKHPQVADEMREILRTARTDSSDYPMEVSRRK